MPKLIKTAVLVEQFALPAKTVPNILEIAERYDEYLAAIKSWAKARYPGAGDVNHSAFAVMVLYLSTEIYGGYGTENHQKERFAETKVYQFYTNCKDYMSEEALSVAVIFFLVSHLLQKAPLEENYKEDLKEAVRLLEGTKTSFKSKAVASARKLIEEVIHESNR